MRPIPLPIRKHLSGDPVMANCLICKISPVEWHHVITGIGRKQINEWWSIAPLCNTHHHGTKDDLDFAKWWCLMRGKRELHKYPKHNLQQELNYLTHKFTG